MKPKHISLPEYISKQIGDKAIKAYKARLREKVEAARLKYHEFHQAQEYFDEMLTLIDEA